MGVGDGMSGGEGTGTAGEGEVELTKQKEEYEEAGNVDTGSGGTSTTDWNELVG